MRKTSAAGLAWSCAISRALRAKAFPMFFAASRILQADFPPRGMDRPRRSGRMSASSHEDMGCHTKKGLRPAPEGTALIGLTGRQNETAAADQGLSGGAGRGVRQPEARKQWNNSDSAPLRPSEALVFFCRGLKNSGVFHIMHEVWPFARFPMAGGRFRSPMSGRPDQTGQDAFRASLPCPASRPDPGIIPLSRVRTSLKGGRCFA